MKRLDQFISKTGIASGGLFGSMYVMVAYYGDRLGTVLIKTFKDIYNEFKSVGSQIIKSDTLLPLDYSPTDEDVITNKVYMPSKNKIVKSLVPKHINVQIWQYLLESFASEQGARMIAMENATENAGDMISDLTLEFNKARQTAITTEMLEIVGGAEALSN